MDCFYANRGIYAIIKLMFKEQFGYFRNFIKLVDFSPLYFGLSFITSVIYRLADIAQPIIAALIIDALTEQNAQKTFYYISFYGLAYLIYSAAFFLNWRVYSRSVTYYYTSLQEKLFKKLISVDNNFYHKINRGKLFNVVNSDLFCIGEMSDNLSEYIVSFMQIIGIVIISLNYNIFVTILMVISTIIASRMRTVHDRKFNYYWWRSMNITDKFSDFINQTLTGLQEIKVFNMLPKLHKHLDNIQKKYDKSYLSQRKHLTVRDNDTKYMVYIFRAAILAVCIIMMALGHMEIDILIMLYSYHGQIIDVVNKFTNVTIETRLYDASIKRVSTILNYKNSDKKEFGNLSLDHISGDIKFKNVSLTLNQHHILKDLNFRIKAHEFVAIVGYPGSGKTKLFDLILRINQPTHGKIFLDDIEINDFSREVYTSNVSVANQVPFIFNTSIRRNLDFVDTNTKHQIEACKTAGIHNFIETLPMGYNTIMRENGGNISGGQRQMISIARTLLTDAEVILLDDVSTSLDPDTAKLIPRLINKIHGERTIIMITKKPELMKIADRIIVLDHGKIADSGTHEKLLKRSSLYRSLQVIRSSEDMGGEGGLA